MEPFDVMDAGRMAVIQDPTGAVFSVWEPNESIGAQLVNAPGALTLTQLNTSDPEKATRSTRRCSAGPAHRGGRPEPYWGSRTAAAIAGMMNLPPARAARRRTGSSTSAARTWTPTPGASASWAAR